MRLHFISGLPRSGSTLLAALLRQNPRFHAAMSSPVAQLLMRAQHAMSRGSEGAVLVDDHQRKKILQGIVANYYAPSKKVTFDTNRIWCAKMPLVAELFPRAKVICCVRDVSWIMNSIEKLIQSNPLELSGIFSYQTQDTVFTRVSGLSGPDGMVGYAINALREAYYGPFSDRLILLDYDALVRDPKKSLDVIYDFLGEQTFEHDFENFEYEAQEFDAVLGTPGLHSVRGPVRVNNQTAILPPGLMLRFREDAFWRDQNNNTKGVPVIMWARRQQKRMTNLEWEIANRLTLAGETLDGDARCD